MLEQQPPVVSHEQIAKLIGETRFKETLSELEKFQIEVQEQNKTSVKATVEGFHAQLVFRNNNLEGTCNCPESDGFDFCIHCAALCLHLNKNAQQITLLSKGPDKSKVLAYLLSQDKQKLAKEFLSLINDDTELFERYLLRAALSQGELDYPSLKTQITDITRKPEKLFSQRQVKHFFARIERFLSELNLLEHYTDPDKMLKLIEHVHQRLLRLLDSIDDNSGQRNDCVATFRILYRKLLIQLHCKEETKAKRFFKFWVNDNHTLLPIDTENFLEADIGEKFLSLLHKICIDNDKKYRATDYSDVQLEKMLRCLIDTYEKRCDADKAMKARERLAKLRA